MSRAEYMRRYRATHPEYKAKAAIRSASPESRAKQEKYREKNRALIKERHLAWRERNRESLREKQRASYAKDPDSWKKRGAKWVAKNPEKKRATYNRWVANNQKRAASLSAESCTRRKATKSMATPAWGDRKKIQEFYENAANLTIETGVRHQVDHIVPLKNKFVCGLHVEHNLRVITALDNAKKKNKFIEELCYV